MSYDPTDTIAAIGTAPGGSPRGMIRLSGPRVIDCLTALFEPEDSSFRLAEVCESSVVAGTLTTPGEQSLSLPCDLFLWPNERSYTRQPTAELHTLGSPPLLAQLLQAFCQQGARLAEPGEFTLRAFLAGRLDLTQAEAVLGVIDAQSSTELDAALTQLAGGLSAPLTELRNQLLQLLAELEAGLDFAEEDIEFISAEHLVNLLTTARAQIEKVISQLSSRAPARELPRVVLLGPPNAGKSSLFNALVERFGVSDSVAPALVSQESGTTRDFVTAVLDLDGVHCTLVDTAGIESQQQEQSIQHSAQAMSQRQQQQAAVVLRCEPASTRSPTTESDAHAGDIFIRTKSDLSAQRTAESSAAIACSSVTGDGITQIAAVLREQLSATSPETNNSVAHTAARCSASLQHAQSALDRALTLARTQGGEELIAAEVRASIHELGQVVGAVYTDDILDRIFAQFCIGK